MLTVLVLTAGLGLAGCGNDSTTSLTPDTTPPLAPVILGARGSDNTISVWWSDNTEPDLNGYNVYVQENGSLVLLNRRPVKNTHFVHHPENATSTVVRVTAVDLAGNESAPATRAVHYEETIDGVDGSIDKLIDGQP